MRRMKGQVPKKVSPLTLIVVLLLGLIVPTPTVQASESNPVHQAVKLDPSYQHASFDGWGTALVWFGNVTGGWPDDIKNELADALFGEDGLNFNIARYNIGGEDSPETEPYMRLGGAVPGYWNRPAEFGPPEDADDDWQEQAGWWDPDNPEHWDWDKDKNQQWWLKAAKSRGANLFEAFSNSPPYFMTESGYTSGNWNSWDDNLRSDQYENFAIYLTRVVQYLQEEIGIDIQTLSPVNEPYNGYWGAKGRQEGSNWAPESQERIINEVAKQLNKLNLDTVVSAMDETHPQRFRENWETYDEETRANVGQMNVHTYWPAQRSSVRDIAKGEGKRLWMSEVDLGPSGIPQDFDNIEPGLALSERITSDIKNLEPKAWVLWQAIEDEVNMNADNENMNWGLIQVDFDPADFDTLEWHKNKKYYTMGNYTKFIRPGYHFINTDHPDALAAIDKPNDRVVVVYTNHTHSEQTIDFDLSGFKTVADNATATPYVTSSTENLVQKDQIKVRNEVLSATVPPKSVTTYVISDVSGVDTGFLKPDVAYKLFNVNSDLVLDRDDTSLVQNKNVRHKATQEWMIKKLTDGYSHKEMYKVMSRQNGEVLTNDNGSLVLAPDENLLAQQWIISTNGTGEYTFINAESKLLVEVYGQSLQEGAPVGQYQANSGSNQTWRIVESGITGVEDKVVWTIPGQAPVLPDEVTVTYGDGDTDKKVVTWEPIKPEQYADENEFIVTGSIEGTGLEAKATVYVSEAAGIEESKVKTVPGVSPTLPDQVTVQLKMGAKVEVPVIWEEIDPVQYEDLGQFSITGTVRGTHIEAIAHIKVAERAIDNLALNTDGSDYPKATASFTGRWDDVNHVNDGDYSDARWTNWDPNHWRESDWVEIEFGEEKSVSEVKFTFYDDRSGTRPPKSLYLEYWDRGRWVEIPDTRMDVDEVEEVLKFPTVNTSKIRTMLTAIPDTCIAIVEMEVMGLSDHPVLSDDASLQEIFIDGEELDGFVPDIFTYEVRLSAASEVPPLSVITSDLFATYDIKMPSSLPGIATITVVSEDNTVTKTYTVDFTVVAGSADVLALVERLEDEGAFERERDAHSLKTHLTAVSRYEAKGLAEKVVKHMNSFKLLLDHLMENALISEAAYDMLYADAESVIENWQ